MGAVGDTVDAVELKNGVVSDLSPMLRLQENWLCLKMGCSGGGAKKGSRNDLLTDLKGRSKHANPRKPEWSRRKRPPG